MYIDNWILQENIFECNDNGHESRAHNNNGIPQDLIIIMTKYIFLKFVYSATQPIIHPETKTDEGY